LRSKAANSSKRLTIENSEMTTSMLEAHPKPSNVYLMKEPTRTPSDCRLLNAQTPQRVLRPTPRQQPKSIRGLGASRKTGRRWSTQKLFC
jgi:hypothetical protein